MITIVSTLVISTVLFKTYGINNTKQKIPIFLTILTIPSISNLYRWYNSKKTMNKKYSPIFLKTKSNLRTVAKS